MLNPVIFIFIIYYLIFIPHLFCHIHFYGAFFFFYKPKLVGYFFKHSYTTITILELVTHFSKSPVKSHVTKLMNYKSLPEVFQHARTAAKNPKDYYHISDSGQGYDAFSFNKNNFQKLITEKDINSVTFHEKKTVVGDASKYSKISKIFNEYSVAKLECQANLGARPGPVDILEFGTFSTENYNSLQEKVDLFSYNKPSIIVENYSDTCTKIVFHYKHSGFADGTIITNSAFEQLKWFYHHLGSTEEMCLYMNHVLENNPLFPLF